MEFGIADNDGIADLLVGSSFGGAYAVFGRRNIGSSGTLELADIIEPNSDRGVFFSDAVRTNAAGEVVLTESGIGRSVSNAGDINNDGIDDVIFANPNIGSRGRTFVVFGQGESGPTNRDPRAVGESFSSNAGEVSRGNVLSNDTDPDGDSLTARLVSNSRRGTLSLQSNGTFSYRANAGFTGRDSFLYKVSDGRGGTDTANVVLTTLPNQPANRNPTANNDFTQTDENREKVINVLANDRDRDNDRLSVLSVRGANNGEVTLRRDSQILYRPNRGFSGRELLTYTVNDGKGGTDTATVRIIIVPEPNKPPIANNDRARTNESQSVTINVLANDRDPNRNDELTVSRTSRPGNGQVVIRNDGQLVYTPNAGFSGRDRFNYEVSDGRKSDAGFVFVDVARSTRSQQLRVTSQSLSANEGDLLTGEVNSREALNDALLQGGIDGNSSISGGRGQILSSTPIVSSTSNAPTDATLGSSQQTITANLPGSRDLDATFSAGQLQVDGAFSAITPPQAFVI